MSDAPKLPTADPQADGAEVPPPSADSVNPSPDSANLSPDTATLSPDAVKLALRKVRDPEINLNIVDLGLIYDIHVDEGDVRVDMSLTSPGCPSGPEIMTEAENEVKAVSGVNNVVINLVWSPPWSPERIDPRVRTYLGM